ncbi:MAG: MSMEG_4193 family putative phosphomutase [Chloroflexi bacterium AL-W]|nr:MSMEG_4193 family putative phosphomutase [Chloroflexi bacterium AL-N1]NOK66187.1 MSMEG_4193 family putative phosphomutase [Chloroflexi bacterium AL-N10]NOK73068.1 MSMEG_4193 family putative phosphomutase [Chloroflexi bacterium AL-N5]NOK79965.1 MSMEG_4193 family putative phosphomutase [Chloroflexi bacterium AL-W]NOK88179.1 MSMEG_4193 family putative phosphomutase [Chloroflexi bacterium AL-N15]
MTLLLLIRHGKNDWVHGRLAGWTPGVHLNDEGRHQAVTLATRLSALPIETIYASPLDRTAETAQAIAGPRGLPLHIVEGLGEVKYGEWQGAELKELYKHELWPGVQYYPSGTRFPGGETLGEAQIRMVSTLDTLRARHPHTMIAVVSHADIIKLAIAYYIGMHLDLFQRLEISTCSVSALQFTKMGPRLLAYNETGSLEHLQIKPPQAAAETQKAGDQTDQDEHAGEETTNTTSASEHPSDVAHNGATNVR